MKGYLNEREKEQHCSLHMIELINCCERGKVDKARKRFVAL